MNNSGESGTGTHDLDQESERRRRAANERRGPSQGAYETAKEIRALHDPRPLLGVYGEPTALMIVDLLTEIIALLLDIKKQGEK